MQICKLHKVPPNLCPCKTATTTAVKAKAVNVPKCMGCGTPYDDTWVECVVSDIVWQQISPTKNEGGLLCICCIAKQVVNLGLGSTVIRITGGPLVARL
jgi:hypothetical protein